MVVVCSFISYLVFVHILAHKYFHKCRTNFCYYYIYFNILWFLSFLKFPIAFQSELNVQRSWPTFSFAYKPEFHCTLVKSKKIKEATLFYCTYRYIVDALLITKPTFSDWIPLKYPSELQDKETTYKASFASKKPHLPKSGKSVPEYENT